MKKETLSKCTNLKLLLIIFIHYYFDLSSKTNDFNYFPTFVNILKLLKYSSLKFLDIYKSN